MTEVDGSIFQTTKQELLQTENGHLECIAAEIITNLKQTTASHMRLFAVYAATTSNNWVNFRLL